MPSMEKHLLNLEFAGKELHRNAKKCGKGKAEKAKMKKGIQKGNTEAAGAHTENATRQKNQEINSLGTSAGGCCGDKGLGDQVRGARSEVYGCCPDGQICTPMQNTGRSNAANGRHNA